MDISILFNIATVLLKQCLVPFKKFLTNSLETSVVQKSFKRALINPLVKKAGVDWKEWSNFHPVSNLPFLSKNLEKVVLRRLIPHISLDDLSEVL